MSSLYVAGGTSTVAVATGDEYRLYGYKWFSSATDANMAFTLARIANEKGVVKEVWSPLCFHGNGSVPLTRVPVDCHFFMLKLLTVILGN